MLQLRLRHHITHTEFDVRLGSFVLTCARDVQLVQLQPSRVAPGGYRTAQPIRVGYTVTCYAQRKRYRQLWAEWELAARGFYPMASHS